MPPEPVEPVLNGSMAIGAVSLAVAKTRAILDNNPLYLNIALLKQSGQVSIRCLPSRRPVSISTPVNHISCFSLVSPLPGTAHKAHLTFANGVSGQLREVIAREAEFNERSDVYTPSWSNS